MKRKFVIQFLDTYSVVLRTNCLLIAQIKFGNLVSIDVKTANDCITIFIPLGGECDDIKEYVKRCESIPKKS